ncbi:MAG TPA: hypothetical protein VJ919_13245 [Tangfeifania sp.]|nr:hypothetical protein [Tangfeifania sp.]
MPRRICKFSNGGFLEFDHGSFDNWCVYVVRPNGQRFAPSDLQYFSRLKKLAENYGNQKIYDDFTVIFNRVSKNIHPEIFDLIALLSRSYGKDQLEMEIWLSVLYAGMVAEENKENARLGKRIKRLGMHQVLLEGIVPGEAAVFSKGKKWRDLDKLMKEKGF